MAINNSTIKTGNDLKPIKSFSVKKTSQKAIFTFFILLIIQVLSEKLLNGEIKDLNSFYVSLIGAVFVAARNIIKNHPYFLG